MKTREDYQRNRKAFLESLVDIHNTEGLEIGALDLPTVLPGEGNCEFADYLSKGDLVKKYGVSKANIVPIKYLVEREAPIHEQIRKRFDYIVLCHVFEHVPDSIGYLQDLELLLKPGGKMVLECPNLFSACMEFLRNPGLASGPGPEGQRTMWVFYGDPRWQDPYMVHRWGYTPESLTTVMQEAGLSQMRQEPAQFKLREPRDMRLVGIKPLEN